MKTSVVYNENAGSAEVLRPLLDECARLTGCELRPSREAGDVAGLVREEIARGAERLIIAGGDGTVSEAIGAIAPHFDRVTLAVLPFGTGNDFARSLGIPLEAEGLREYLRLEIPPVPVDVVKMSGHRAGYFANAANGGLGGSIAQSIDPATKERWGPVAYWFSALSSAVNYPVYRARIELDDETIQQEIAAIAVANGRFVGGGFPVAPNALIDDGELDVTIVPPLPILSMATSGITFALNLSELSPNVIQRRARRIRIQAEPEIPYSIDGEAVSAFDAVFEVAAGVLQVIPGPLEAALSRA